MANVPPHENETLNDLISQDVVNHKLLFFSERRTKEFAMCFDIDGMGSCVVIVPEGLRASNEALPHRSASVLSAGARHDRDRNRVASS